MTNLAAVWKVAKAKLGDNNKLDGFESCHSHAAFENTHRVESNSWSPSTHSDCIPHILTQLVFLQLDSAQLRLKELRLRLDSDL